jgi:hypothetical protein
MKEGLFKYHSEIKTKCRFLKILFTSYLFFVVTNELIPYCLV